MSKVSKPNLAKEKIAKVVVNTGVGRFATQPNFEEKILPVLIADIEAITGQHPSNREAKKSIAGFKTREGNIIGLKVTLRGDRMASFLEKLAKVVFPRVRDFRGLNLQGIDRDGNLSIGIKEHNAFPEIVPEQSKFDLGLEVTIVPKHKQERTEAIALYRQLGIPFKKK